MYGFSSFYFYFLVFYVCYAFIFSIIYTKRRKSLSYLLFLFLPLFILAAFRGNTVGGDMDAHYLPNFHWACNAKTFEEAISVSSHEPGFRFLTAAISKISHEERSFIVITSLLSLIGPFLIIYRFSPFFAFSILIYYMMGYYTNTFNNIRQSIAVSFFFACFPFLIKRKPWHYYCSVLLACMFHYSAFALLFVYPFVKKAITMKKILITILLGGIFYVILGTSIIFNIVSLFFLKYDPETIIEEKGGKGWNLLFLYIILFVLFVLMYFRNRKYIERRGDGYLLSVLLTLQLISLIFQLFATLYSSVTRMGQYFFIPSIITIPYLLLFFRSKLLRLCFCLFVSFYCLFFFNNTFSQREDTDSNKQGVIPYVFVNKRFDIF